MPPQILAPQELQALLAGYEQPSQASDTPFDSPFLRLFVSTDRSRLSQFFTERTCIPGEIIFRENQAGDTMYLIWSGRVAVLKGDLQAPVVLGYRSAGEIIGEMAVLDNLPRSASVVALTALRLFGLTREKFQQLLNATPSASWLVMSLLSARLRKSDDIRSRGEVSEKQLLGKVTELQTEKHRLEEAQRLMQETSDLIIHDLRNPLGAITISIKMLAMTLPPEVLQQNQELIDIADSSADRMMRLVNNLLEVSRMEAGESPLILSEFDLQGLIGDVAARAALLDQKGTDLQSKVAPKLPMIVADRDKIERVLTNLVDNALKYVPAKGRIVITARPEGDLVRLSVTDNGPGIAPEERERIFARFTQTATEKARRRGFGLGLSYCKLAVEAHGGKIWVEAGEGGVGSRFVFTLPVKPPAG